MNTFGRNFKVTTFGESHGKALGAVIDGCPAGIMLSEDDIQEQLARRRPGQSHITTPRDEKDQVEIFSGVFEGKTTGTPICAMVFNRDQHSKDYSHLKEVYRPGHADQMWQEKFGHRDYRGGGRSSGRETIGRVIGGAVARRFLPDLKIVAHTESLDQIQASDVDYSEIENNLIRCADKQKAAEMIALIEQAKESHESLGGVVRVDILNPPKYIGEPVFGKFEARLAEALMSIGATRSFEFGEFHTRGSVQNKVNEGISGGMATGDMITIRVKVKPTPSVAQKQEAQNIYGEKIDLEIAGRHDPVILPRFIPVAEAMCYLVVADLVLSPISKI